MLTIQFGNNTAQIAAARKNLEWAHQRVENFLTQYGGPDVTKASWNTGSETYLAALGGIANVEKAYISEFEFAPPTTPSLKFGEQLKKLTLPLFGNMYIPANPYGSAEALQAEKAKASANIAWAHDKLKNYRERFDKDNWGQHTGTYAAGVGAIALGEEAFLRQFDFTS